MADGVYVREPQCNTLRFHALPAPTQPELDKKETPEEAAAVAEARAELARGEVISDEELRRELDL